MNIIVLINIGLIVVILFALVFTIKGWEKVFFKDAKFLFITLLVLILIHGTLNSLEWWAYPGLDPLGDLIEILEPLVWLFFLYAFLKEVDERYLSESERRFRKLFESLDVAIVIHGPEGNIQSANPAAEEALGLKVEEMKKRDLSFWKGKIYDENRDPMKLEEYPLSRAIVSERPAVDVIGIRASDQKEISWYSISAVPHKDEEGEVEKVITSFKDITDTKKTEERKDFLNVLIRQDLASKFRTIYGYLILLEEEEISEKAEVYLGRAMRSGDKTQQILTLAKELRKIDRGEWKLEKDIFEIIEQVTEEISVEDEDVEIDKRYSKDTARMIKSDYSLKELFSHLLKVRIKTARSSKVIIEVDESDEDVIVSIIDDGARLPEDIKELFSGKVYMGESSGAGGVLYYMIKQISESIDAMMEVKDSELGGARFDIYLERADS